jgi:hypothetical protein
MKKFFDLYTITMLLIFILGLIVTGTSGNWTAFIWIITGILWMLMSRRHELSSEELKLYYESKIAELRLNRDEYLKLYKQYQDKYDAKLKENYDLTCDNQSLTEANEYLAKINLELSEKNKTQDTQAEQEAPVQGKLKVKVKKKKSTQMREQ